MIEETKKYILHPSRLVGTIKLSGAKNSALRLLAASLLTGDKIEIDNYPEGIIDGKIHVEMLRFLGKECQVETDRITITEPHGIRNDLQWDGFSIRNTLLILGALVTRTGRGAVPLPGGCQLGDRKYDLHEMVLRQMAADVWSEGGMLMAEAKGRLKGADIHLPVRSTGATENAILCGSLAEGITRIWNPHIRPEILDLIDFLKKMGAHIVVYGQESIEVEGKEGLLGTTHRVVPDNMEAITWLIGSVVTNGDVEIVDFPFDHLEVPLVHLRESGAKFYRGDDRLIVRGGTCYPIDISTGPYPGINSDMQPFFTLYGLCANGESRIIDLRFPGRYNYLYEMKKIGAQFNIKDNMLSIIGGKKLEGAPVMATDLRAGAALALAGLVAEGETVIEDAWQIHRGYNRFHEKMSDLGASLIREK